MCRGGDLLPVARAAGEHLLDLCGGHTRLADRIVRRDQQHVGVDPQQALGELLRLFARQGPIRQRYVLRLVLLTGLLQRLGQCGIRDGEVLPAAGPLATIDFQLLLVGRDREDPPASIDNDSGMLIATARFPSLWPRPDWGMVNANAATVTPSTAVRTLRIIASFYW